MVNLEYDICVWYKAYQQQCESSRKLYPDPSDERRYESVKNYVEQGCLDCFGRIKTKDCYASYTNTIGEFLKAKTANNFISKEFIERLYSLEDKV